MKLVDTTFLIDITRSDKAAILKAKEADNGIRILCAEISRYEMISGICSLQNLSGAVLGKKLGQLESLFKNFECLSFGQQEATAAGMIAGELYRKGRPIGDTDCLIAGTALANGISIIITRNKSHFERIPGITVETY